MSAPYERLMVLDFESAWCTKTGYTLSKMTVEEYVRDRRFMAWGLSYKWYGEDKIRWVTRDRLPEFFTGIDWTKTAVLCHNAQFDAFILSEIYGVDPCFIIDSLSMARAVRGTDVKNSLKVLAEEFGLPAKGNALHGTNGILMGPLAPHVEAELAEYCNHDVYLCEKVFDCLRFGLTKIGDPTETYTQEFPAKELRLIDMTLKMFTQPRLVLDADMLAEAIEDERVKREGLLARLGVDADELASNLKFAAILDRMGVEVPMKPSKTKPNTMTMALAKTDAVFQSMLNGANEELALLCETRLAVKSTLERTRAQRFLDIHSRGKLPVPLRYFAALNMRWGGDQQINMQNMKRGSFLRRAIMAPPGYVIVVTDLSQIEPRVLAYLSGYEALLDIFRSGADAYATFGAQMFNIPGLTKERYPELRQSAKSAMLGCWEAATKVLTERGWVCIVDVLLSDKLWDGQEWVRHAGVVAQGVKETEYAYGVAGTSDHKVLTQCGWREWREVHTNPSLFQSALSSASLPYSSGGAAFRPAATSSTHLGYGARAGTKSFQTKPSCPPDVRNVVTRAGLRELGRPSPTDQRSRFRYLLAQGWALLRVWSGRFTEGTTSPACVAPVGGRASLRAPILRAFQSAALALKNKQSSVGGSRKGILMCALTANTATACWTELAPQSFAALTLARLCMRITAHAASGCTRLGTTTAPRFSRTSWVSPDGTSQRCSSTASTTTRGTSPATFASAQGATTQKTSAESGCEKSKISNAASPVSKKRTQTYDIRLAGPRSRYTILTSEGPIVVHNCGYQLGWASFATQLLAGFLGAAPKMYTKQEAKQLGVNAAYIHKFTGWHVNMKRMREIPHTCSEEELLIHCVAAKKIIDLYRAAASPVVDFWSVCQDAISRCLMGGSTYEHKCLTFERGRILMPNGLALRYPDLRSSVSEETGKVQWFYGNGKTLHGGKLTENVVSAVARCVMSDGMLRIKKRYPVVLTAHDEVGALVPEQEAEEGSKWIHEQMVVDPKYLPGIPLNAGTGYAVRYGDAKV